MMDPNKNHNTITDDPNGKDSLGAMLRAARERAGLSREALAGKVNLLSQQIAALEEDRHERLPGAMFVRAYLRNIARALDLDEPALQAAYQRLLPAVANSSASRNAVMAVDRPTRPIPLEGSTSAHRHWGVAVAALVVVGLWGWQHSERDAGRALSLTPGVMVNGETKPLPGGIEDALAGNAQSQLMDSVELLSTSADTAAPTTPASTAAAVAQQQLASEDSKTITAEGDQLSLRFSADCWVEIKDRDNRVLVAALKHSNERLQLQGKGPFRVLLGFAPGVEMAYNGTPVNIEVSQGARSARLIVGSS